MSQKQMKCPQCNTIRLFAKEHRTMDVAMLWGWSFFAVITCGLGIPFAILFALLEGRRIASARWHCQTCGFAEGDSITLEAYIKETDCANARKV